MRQRDTPVTHKRKTVRYERIWTVRTGQVSADVEQNRLGTDNERTITGEFSIGCPSAILNMHKIPQRIHRTSMYR